MIKNKHERIHFYIGNLLHGDIYNINLNGNIKIQSPFPSHIYDEPLKNLLIKTNNYGKRLNYTLGDNSSNTCPASLS